LGNKAVWHSTPTARPQAVGAGGQTAWIQGVNLGNKAVWHTAPTARPHAVGAGGQTACGKEVGLGNKAVWHSAPTARPQKKIKEFLYFCPFLFQMKLNYNELYHIYNQGNNRRQVFFSDEDYLKFLTLFRDKVLPFADVFAWCLMPNHFHFLLSPNSTGIEEIKTGNILSSRIGNGLRLLQTQYAQFINRKQNNTGSVFRQKAKASEMAKEEVHYPTVCFNYIHQNPLRAGLVSKLEDWPYSSFAGYAGFRSEDICKKNLAFQLLLIDENNFQSESLKAIPEEYLKKVRPTF